MKDAMCMTRPKRSVGVSTSTRELAPWFHNLHLPDGTQTAPDHPLGDFPACKWTQIEPHLPKDLSGWTVLDVGCNAGFYSIELARRGAHVTGIDCDPHFLKQAAWAIREFGLEDAITLRQMQVYDLAHTREQFDLVLFLGVFYHLRYPVLGLDIVAERSRQLFLFQTLTMPGDDVLAPAEDYGLYEREVMANPGWPKLAFIEKSWAGDPSNWWAPNHAAVEALLRSTGLRHIERLGHEIYLCQANPHGRSNGASAVAAELHAAMGLSSNGQAQLSPRPAKHRRAQNVSRHFDRKRR